MHGYDKKKPFDLELAPKLTRANFDIFFFFGKRACRDMRVITCKYSWPRRIARMDWLARAPASLHSPIPTWYENPLCWW